MKKDKNTIKVIKPSINEENNSTPKPNISPEVELAIPKKNRVLIYLLLTILLCLTMFGTGYNIRQYQKDQNKTENKLEETKLEGTTDKHIEVNETINTGESIDGNIDNNISLNKEETITDTSLINDLEKKTKLLYKTGGYSMPTDDANLLFTSIDTKEPITDSSKLLSIITNYKVYDENIVKELITDEQISTYFPSLVGSGKDLATDYQISEQSLNNIYKDLYNTDIPNPQVELDGCPNIRYDEQNHKYLIVARCGGVSFDKLLTYNYKYTKDDNNAYVYVSTGYSKEDPATQALTIYSDASATNDYKQETEHSIFTMDNSNYQDFTKYKLTFSYNKETDNYYFTKIEKINE